MTWLRLDDGFPSHPKVVQLTDAAFRAHVSALCYASQHLTDGFIPHAWARSLGNKPVAELTKAGLWRAVAAGYQIHDFLDFNPSKQTVNDERSRRRAAGRAGGLATAAARARAVAPPPAAPNVEQHPPEDFRPDPTRPVPTPTPKAELRSVPEDQAPANPGNPYQLTDDQLYLGRQISEKLTPPAIVKLNKEFGVEAVSAVLREVHGFKDPGEVLNAYAYVLSILRERQEAG